MIDLSPSFFCFERHRTWSVSCLCCFPLVLSLPLGRRAFPSPRLACRPSGRAAGRCLSCRRAVRCRLSLVACSPCRLAERWAAGYLPAFLISALSSVCGSLCVPRLVAQCGQRVACPAWLVPVIGTGGGTGSSACLDEAGGGVCGLCGVSFSRLITSGLAGILILVP